MDSNLIFQLCALVLIERIICDELSVIWLKSGRFLLFTMGELCFQLVKSSKQFYKFNLRLLKLSQTQNGSTQTTRFQFIL